MTTERKALERLGAEIQKPYPESAFAELTKAEWATARDVLRGAGISLDRVSASNMRHVGKVVAEAPERFREALASEPESVEPKFIPTGDEHLIDPTQIGRAPESASVGELRVGVARTLHLVCNIGIGEAGGVGVGWDTLSERERELWLYDESTGTILALLATHTKPAENELIRFANWKALTEYVGSQGFAVVQARTHTSTGERVCPDGPSLLATYAKPPEPNVVILDDSGCGCRVLPPTDPATAETGESE